MRAQRPDGVAGGLPAVLESTSVGSLSFSVGANIQNAGAHETRIGCSAAKHIHDGNTWKVIRAELIDGNIAKRTARDRARAERLFIVHPGLLANKPHGLRRAEIGLKQVRVDDGEHLRTRVEMLGKSRNTGVGVRRQRWIMLVEVLQRKCVLRCNVVVEIGHRHVSLEAASARKKGVERSSGRKGGRSSIIGYEPFARLARKRRRIEQSQGRVIDVRTRQPRPKVIVDDTREASSTTGCVRETNRHVDKVVADLLIGDL